MPDERQQQAFAGAFPDGLLFRYPKSAGSVARDHKWLGSWRYGIVHLDGRDEAELRQRCEQASGLLGWPAPYAELAVPAASLSREDALQPVPLKVTPAIRT
jgi:hypothetical protein